jgi:hypothetical protein
LPSASPISAAHAEPLHTELPIRHNSPIPTSESYPGLSSDAAGKNATSTPSELIGGQHFEAEVLPTLGTLEDKYTTQKNEEALKAAVILVTGVDDSRLKEHHLVSAIMAYPSLHLPRLYDELKNVEPHDMRLRLLQKLVDRKDTTKPPQQDESITKMRQKIRNDISKLAEAGQLHAEIRNSTQLQLPERYEQAQMIESPDLRLQLFHDIVKKTNTGQFSSDDKLEFPLMAMRRAILNKEFPLSKELARPYAGVLQAFGSGRSDEEWQMLWPMVKAHAERNPELRTSLFANVSRTRSSKEALPVLKEAYYSLERPHVDTRQIEEAALLLIHISRDDKDDPSEQPRHFQHALADFTNNTQAQEYVTSGIAVHASETLAQEIHEMLESNSQITPKIQFNIRSKIFGSLNPKLKETLLNKINTKKISESVPTIMAYLNSAKLEDLEKLEFLIQTVSPRGKSLLLSRLALRKTELQRNQ